jgi:hypothetical protein
MQLVYEEGFYIDEMFGTKCTSFIVTAVMHAVIFCSTCESVRDFYVFGVNIRMPYAMKCMRKAVDVRPDALFCHE